MPIPVISPMRFLMIAQRAGPIAKNTAQGGDLYKGRPLKWLADGNKVGNFLNNFLRFGKTGKIGDSNFSRFGYGRNVVRQRLQKTQMDKIISGQVSTPRAAMPLPIGLLPLYAAFQEDATSGDGYATVEQMNALRDTSLPEENASSTESALVKREASEPDDGYATIQEMNALRDASLPAEKAAGAESAPVNSEPVYARIERDGLAKVKRQKPAVSESVPPPPPKKTGLEKLMPVRKLAPSSDGVDSLHSQAASSSTLKEANSKSVEIPLILSKYRVTIDALEAFGKKSSVLSESKETPV